VVKSYHYVSGSLVSYLVKADKQGLYSSILETSLKSEHAIVSSMQVAGVAGRGAMAQALLAGGGTIGVKNILQLLLPHRWRPAAG